MVVGNSLSGQDISMELVEVAKEVHLSAKSLNITEGLSKVISKRENLHLHPQVYLICIFHPIEPLFHHLYYFENSNDSKVYFFQIDRLHEDGKVLFVDGSWVMADTILYCTG